MELLHSPGGLRRRLTQAVFLIYTGIFGYIAWFSLQEWERAGYLYSLLSSPGRACAVLLGCLHLRKNFGSSQISRKAALSGCAESTAHFASNLRRNTDRVSMMILHQHTLHTLSVQKAKQIFYGSIQSGNLLSDDGNRGYVVLLLKAAPKLFRKIRHFLKGGYTSVKPPVVCR